MRPSLIVVLVLVVAACGSDSGDGSGDSPDATPVCAPPVATYTTEVRAGKGTCDEDLIVAQLLPLGDVVIDEGASCGPFVAGSYDLSDECNATAELTVELTDDALSDGRLDVVAASCPGECTHAFPVTLTPDGIRP